MAFDEVQFMKAIYAFGTSGGPGHMTKITETDSGHEGRIARWTYPRYRFNVSILERSNAEVASIREFVIARQGALRGFRLKDHNDYTSNSDGTTAPTNSDVQIGTGDGTTVRYPLIKKYTSGLSTVNRKIIKPVSGTVLVAIAGTPQTLGSDYTLDTTTGYIDFTVGGAPGDTLAITAGYEFDVPVRFSEDIDDWLSSIRSDVDANQIRSLEMVELFTPSPVNIDRPYLGGIEKVITGDIVVSLLEAHTYVIDAQSTGLSVVTPPASSLPTGGELWSIINAGTNSIAIKDDLGATIRASVAANEGIDIHLSDDGIGGYVWYAF